MTFRLALALVVVSSSFASAQRVSFPPFTGKNGAAVRNQLISTVCDTLDCVPATQTTTKNKPDWKKAKKAQVQSFITGTVTKKGLELSVFNKAGKPSSKKTFPLDKAGTLSAKNLQSAMEMLGVTLDTASPEPTPPIEPAAKPVTTRPEPEPTPAPEPVAVKKKAPPEPEPEKKSDGAKPRFLVLEAGVDILNRSLGYSQVATGNLRDYNLAAFAAVKLGLEFYPIALTGRDDVLAGLGAEFNISFAPWLSSGLASSEERFPTSAMRIDGGVRWAIVPVKSYPFAIIPYVGVRHQSFTVGALSDGRRLDGLPNVAFTGLRVGLGVEVPIVPQVLFLFGRFGAVPTFSSGEIISPAFFANGSTLGLEGNAGLAVRVSIIELRASFEIANWGMTFTTQPTDRYVAASGNDRYLGGNVALRLNF
ncbi:MAG: hypothetical protein DI536_17760 [Archangium gephyra]|uniref:Outer membrane protein beta-barrel domain-containing protein n=1 Tax=Archangium gephyra TaxID=48 RepID=A0A2W5T9A7_9BACT|nr:MAG: hypothetical protein DI536_17760 [Archangium gephyra]